MQKIGGREGECKKRLVRESEKKNAGREIIQKKLERVQKRLAEDSAKN